MTTYRIVDGFDSKDISNGVWATGRGVGYTFTAANILRTLDFGAGVEARVVITSQNVAKGQSSTEWVIAPDKVGTAITGVVYVNGGVQEFKIPTHVSSPFTMEITGSNSSETINGRDNSHDIMFGRNGTDTLYGRSGDDVLYGDGGNDRLYGGTGNDRLYGGTGSDVLTGQAGRDTLTGGAGADNFVIATKDARDTITDFYWHNEHDKLSIQDTLFSASKSKIEASIEDFVIARTVGNDTIISIDADGRGAGKAVDVVLLQNIKNVDIDLLHKQGALDII